MASCANQSGDQPCLVHLDVDEKIEDKTREETEKRDKRRRKEKKREETEKREEAKFRR